MRPPVHVPEGLKLKQRSAGDPGRSVWVSANAGSGKTYVLTERVVRLLLAGVPPDQILCLTYTKAAAAEMRKRVAGRLGAWAIADEPTLFALLTETEGVPPDAARLMRARTLFAHALETPGGLKIMTIHAYCESVLHRFPKEAGVPFDFRVIEDNDRSRIIAEERAQVLADGLNGTGAAGAVETLFQCMSDSQIEAAISAALADQRMLRDILADVEGAKANLRRRHGNAVSSSAAVLAEISEGFSLDRMDLNRLFALQGPNKGEAQLQMSLAALDLQRPHPRALLRAFLTQEHVARKKFLSKESMLANPGLEDALQNEAMRLELRWPDLVAAELMERSDAVLDVLAAIHRRYEARKRAQSLLDFDDLIAALTRLLASPGAGEWVSYKLDSGLTHILLDEGQDTNFEQWQVVDLLAADFFDGESAAQRLRTIFAVGDKKQSIYSFQGANPELFVDKASEYAMRIETARMTFEQVPIHTSFRTLPEVLAAVDLTFADPVLKDGVLAIDEPVDHDSARIGTGGRVVLWSPIQNAPTPADADNWDVVPPQGSAQSAERRVALNIARQIRSWIDDGRMLPGRNRAVTASDVLVLLQTRGRQFDEVIRALVQMGLPTPGADRLDVTTHIAVLDLMALGDVLLAPGDDLQLAAVLRSPLFEVSEDDLFRVAHARGPDTRLWAAMIECPIPSVQAASERLVRWRNRLDFDRPYNFYADVLYREGGLRAFHGRLGSEVDDVLAAFLELALQHEQARQPSLQGFLAALRETDISIKRELGESGGGVRVMTVHGAKGLEAPIVIVADAASTERGRDRTSVYMLGAPRPCFIHAGNAEQHTTVTADIKKDIAAEAGKEYWRKLYVAMTRAEDELYVTGALTQTGKLDGSWYEAIERALRPVADSVVDEAGEERALVFPAGQADPRFGAVATTLPAAVLPAVPEPLPPYRLRRIVRPSTAFAEEDGLAALDSAAGRTGRDPGAARREGVALHALLQHLSHIDQGQRRQVADKALATLLPDYPAEHARLAEKALSILSQPALADLFGASSRAEVPVLAKGRRGGEEILIAGRIDRLVVDGERVLIVDFKSDAEPADSLAAIPDGYVRQLGLYALVAGQLFPGATVEAAILWTELESLMILPPYRLVAAVESITLG